MPKFKVALDGKFEDEVFDTEEEAEEYALYLSSCAREGAEILHLSNPGDYDEDDCEDNYEVVQVEE